MAESLKDLLVSFNGSSEYDEAIASTERGKVYVPTNADVIVIDKRVVGSGDADHVKVKINNTDTAVSLALKGLIESGNYAAYKATRDGDGNNIVNTYATKAELNDKLNASDAMVLAGTISGTGVIQKHNDSVVTQNVTNNTTNISALTDYKAGWTWRVSSNGTITGLGKVESGDMVMCISDYDTSYKASDWTAIQRNIDLATEDAAGLMSADDKVKVNSISGMQTHLDSIDTTLAGIPETYATKTALNTVSSTATTASTNATNALSKVNNIINGTTVVPAATNAQTAQKATQDGNGNNIASTYATKDTATTTANGLMSSTDKSKLDGIASGAQKNQNAFSNVKVVKGSSNSTIQADTTTDTLTLTQGDGIELTADTTNDGVTIKAKTATADAAGTVKVSSVNSSAVTVNSESTTEGRYYPVELNSDGKAIVNVPWTDNNTDTKVKQTAPVTTAADYQVLISKSANATEETNTVQKSGMTYNPNTKKLTGPTQVGDVTLANVVTSTNYTSKIGTATDSKAGLMSADQRNALEAVKTGLEDANVDIAALIKALTWE